MILLLLNFVFVFIGGAYVLTAGVAPKFVGIACLVLGGFVLVSRLLAWGSGAAQAAYLMAAQTPGMASRMGIMEGLYWVLGIANVGLFFAGGA